MGFSFPIFLIGISREEVAIRNLPERHLCSDYEGCCVGNTGHYLVIPAWFLPLEADFRTTFRPHVSYSGVSSFSFWKPAAQYNLLQQFYLAQALLRDLFLSPPTAQHHPPTWEEGLGTRLYLPWILFSLPEEFLSLNLLHKWILVIHKIILRY